MNFQRIGSFVGIATFILLLLVGARARAESVDDDMPPPQDRVGAEMPLGQPPEKELHSRDEALPNPSLGEEALPEPQEEAGKEKSKNLVNKAPEDDDIFLPTPAVNDNINYAPIGSPTAGRMTAEDLDWRVASGSRPIFMLHGGLTQRNYPSSVVKSSGQGYLAGASMRFFNIAQTIFVHGYASFTFTNLKDVGPYQDTKDLTSRFGGMLEIALGRRWSLYGTVFRRSNLLTSPRSQSETQNAERNQSYFENVSEAPNLVLGAGLQYDFWVVPHGSMGVLAQVERNAGMVVLTLAIEPAPRKKLSLNFNEMDQE